MLLNRTKTVLWIDDDSLQQASAQRMVASLKGVSLKIVPSSESARRVLEMEPVVDCVVTDILRRTPDGRVTPDDGYQFFQAFIRQHWPTLPVIFHTKNLPSSFQVDSYSQYLSKWEKEDLKTVELEVRLADTTRLYEAFADSRDWERIKPRLVTVQQEILNQLRSIEEFWLLTPDSFEQLVAELLQRIGYKVLWVPGGSDGGVDIIAGSPDHSFLIDVKRYKPTYPVGVELVRQVYGIAAAWQQQEPNNYIGGIITSSRFTSEAEKYRDAVRPRPLLRDFDWIRRELEEYAPRLIHKSS